MVPITLFAQDSDATIFGTIVNNQTGAPLQFVTVAVQRDVDVARPIGALSNAAGYFEISGLVEGNYAITASLAGFQPAEVAVLVFACNANYNLGTLALAASGQPIEEVIVVGQQQDGRVQLRGSDRVVILINGKQSSLTGFGNQAGLDSIPADNIQSVEIINNPSSQFDATGMAGVINITYKDDDTLGFSGNVGFTAGVGQLSKRKEDLPTEPDSFSTNPKAIPSINLGYNTETVRYHMNLEVFIREGLPNNEFTTRFYDDGRLTYSQVPENRKQIQGILNTDVDWNIDVNNLLTVSAIIDYESHQNNDEDYFLNDRSAIRNSTDVFHLKATTHTLLVQIDYMKPLRNGRAELGAKYQRRWIPVTYDVERGVDSIIYEGLGDWSEWGEDVYSVYANLVRETLAWGIEGGVRIKQTDVYYDLAADNIYYPRNDAYDYFKVYPNFRLGYNLSDSSRLALYYSSRVDRPGEQELRIFPKYDDPEILKVGNPYLRPQFTTTIELAWEQSWDKGSFIFSVYHRAIDDSFIRIFDIDASNPQYSIINRLYTNVGSATNDGIEMILTQDIGDFWKLSGSLNWFENKVDQYATQLLFPVVRPFTVAASTDATWNLSLNNQLNLPWDIRMQLSLTYYAPKNFAQGQDAARSSVDMGFRKTVLGDKGELTFSVTDLFNKFGISQDIEGNGFNAVYENFYETQVVSMGLRYYL